MAPSKPLALLITVSAALPTIPVSSVGVRAGADADEGVITALLGDDLLLGDVGGVPFLLKLPLVKGLLRPSTGEFDGVGFVDLYSSKVPVSFSSPSESGCV